MATYNTKSYVQDRVEPNKVTLVGPSHTVSDIQNVAFGRTAPKPSGASLGVARGEVKCVRTGVINASTGAKANAQLSTSISVPVGFNPATLDDLIADYRAVVASADFVNLVKNGKVNVT